MLMTHELYSKWCTYSFLLSFRFRSHDLENGVKSNNESLSGLTVFRVMIKYTFGSQYEYDCLVVCLFKKEIWTDNRIGGNEFEIIIEKITFVVHFVNIIINKLNKWKFSIICKKAYCAALFYLNKSKKLTLFSFYSRNLELSKIQSNKYCALNQIF